MTDVGVTIKLPVPADYAESLSLPRPDAAPPWDSEVRSLRMDGFDLGEWSLVEISRRWDPTTFQPVYWATFWRPTP